MHVYICLCRCPCVSLGEPAKAVEFWEEKAREWWLSWYFMKLLPSLHGSTRFWGDLEWKSDRRKDLFCWGFKGEMRLSWSFKLKCVGWWKKRMSKWNGLCKALAVGWSFKGCAFYDISSDSSLLKVCTIEECYNCVAVSLNRLLMGEVAAILQFQGSPFT